MKLQKPRERGKESVQSGPPFPTTTPMMPQAKALGPFFTQCNVGTVTGGQTIERRAGEGVREGWWRERERDGQRQKTWGFAQKTR